MLTILFDQSGSLAGCRMQKVKTIVKNFMDTCKQLGTPIAVYGHTADTEGKDLVMIPYIDFEGNQIEDINNACARANNYDGAAIRFITENIKNFNDNKVIIITDGLPACYSYYGSEGIQDTKDAVQDLKKYSEVTTMLLSGPYIEDEKEDLENIYGSITYI